jgi:hypothetical protein
MPKPTTFGQGWQFAVGMLLKNNILNHSARNVWFDAGKAPD